MGYSVMRMVAASAHVPQSDGVDDGLSERALALVIDRFNGSMHGTPVKFSQIQNSPVLVSVNWNRHV